MNSGTAAPQPPPPTGTLRLRSGQAIRREEGDSGQVAEVFRALGDPVRLAMVQRLIQKQPCTIAAVSSGLGITRQGARKHLQVLVGARLATLEPRGRDVIVSLDAGRLEQAQAFIDELARRWDVRLAALQRLVEEADE